MTAFPPNPGPDPRAPRPTTQGLPTLGVIGGSGMETQAALGEERTVETPFGAVAVRLGTAEESRVAFLLRHGRGHFRLPHEVEYRANLWALRALGVRQVLSTVADRKSTRL